MSISMRNDVAPHFELGSSFRMSTINGFSGGSFLNHVRNDIADKNFYDFQDSWSGSVFRPDRAKRNVNGALARKFNMTRPGDREIFDTLWPITSEAFSFKKNQKDEIEEALEDAYRFAARLARNESLDTGRDLPTWSRVETTSAENIVIFSDHHMTNFSNIALPNYFLDRNYDLYMDVLRHYDDQEFTLVENGDLEECIIVEHTLEDARERAAALADFPILSDDDSDWADYYDVRYDARDNVLGDIFPAFSRYYELIRNQFATNGRYYRLSGNHDTFLDEPRERELLGRVEAEIGSTVHDVLKVMRGDRVQYLVMHGHQFDTVSTQSTQPPYAKSLGETFSELSSWLYQGPDRFWPLQDTLAWINGAPFENILARETPDPYHGWSVGEWLGGDGAYDLLTSSLSRIRQDPRGFVESLLGAEIAWEYFRNDDAFNAFALEVLTGETMFKFRHLNERSLCQRYHYHYLQVDGPNRFPETKLVLGHTHEPRKNSINPDFNSDSAVDYYLNTGSAGRFENLIWAVEISGNEDRIISWSRVDGRLKKITWDTAPIEQGLSEQQARAAYGNLVQMDVEFFDILPT